jgi:signal transduction histidine kinase
MRYVQWARVRSGRLLAVLPIALIYFLLLTVDALRFFPHHMTTLSWTEYGFSVFVALLFFAVGALVWLYARSRPVALLLLGFCFAMMMTFAVETEAVLNDPVLSAVSGSSSALTLLLFFLLLLLFPKNRLSSSVQLVGWPGKEIQGSRQSYLHLLLRGYLAVLAGLSVLTVVYSLLQYLLLLRFPDWLTTIKNSYYLLVLTGILITIIVSYRQSSSLRERQQLRIFVGGVILAFAPLLILTVLPLVFRFPGVDSQFSTITLVLLPFALGYSILRYQILVLDMYIRRVAAWMVGVVNLAVLGYVVSAFSSIFLSNDVVAYTICIVVTMVVLGPLAWWLAHVVTERLFFSEITYYRRLIDQPDLLARKTFDISGAAELITTAAVNAFETQEVCLYVLDKVTGRYQLYPPFRDNDLKDDPRRSFVQRLLLAVSPSAPGDGKVGMHIALAQDADWLSLPNAILDVIERIDSAERPLLLSEASRDNGEGPVGLARYLATTSPLRSFDPLLARIRAQGKMIGVLLLGERGDHQQYAGPDFEAIYLIQARFSPVLETARLYAQANRHAAILDALYSSLARVRGTFESVEEVAVAYTRVAAEAVEAGAETWLYDQTDHQLHHVIHAGSGAQLIPPGTAISPLESDWSPWFYQASSPSSPGGLSTEVTSCLPQTPHFSCAWLPLNGTQQHLGVLALTYPRPHLFSQEEQRVLGMFADQFAFTLENARFTAELRVAYQRQKELDRLKDQFIMTASHELRTPLTAVQGYIELLDTYNHKLPSDRRAEFIAKAHRGCDELALMVENIMDASRVQVDAENITLRQVPLAESVRHITEILEGLTSREHRSINVDIPADAYVIADELRLRQVLLNLVSNALKYSPAGTDVNIASRTDDENVMVSIRDRGLGVPQKDQERLFERFVRLERDMNSSIRGAGLGLYISKQLIEAMGGHIWMESTGKEGEGSVFVFTLKCALVTREMSGRSALEHRQAL